jgi:translocator protein
MPATPSIDRPLAPQSSGSRLGSLAVLAGFLGASLLAALLGSLATASSVGAWYAALAKPAWTPPNWLFGPAWTVLYVMMAVAAWLVWQRRGSEGAGAALALYGVQLAVNAAWSFLFFGLRSPALGLAGIAVLWVLIVLTIRAFRPIRPLAAGLLVPYLLWVTYAAALNGAVWKLNA